MVEQVASHAERIASMEAQLAAIREARADRDREMKAVKARQDGIEAELAETVRAINAKLELLIEDKAKRDGALGLGRWLFAIGLPSMAGAFALEVWHLLGGKH